MELDQKNTWTHFLFEKIVIYESMDWNKYWIGKFMFRDNIKNSRYFLRFFYTNSRNQWI